LNRTVDRILDIDEHTHEANLFTGNYDSYVVQKDQHLKKWRNQYDEQQVELKMLRHLLKSKATTTNQKRNIRSSDGDKFIKHFKDQTADKTLSRQVGNLEERLRQLENDRLLAPPKPLTINTELDPTMLAANFPITVSGIYKSFEGRVLLNNVSFSVGAGEQIAITGANGIGKSTLIKLIVGEIIPDAGNITIAPSVRLGYLPQSDNLPHGDTLIEAYSYGLDGNYEEHKASLVGSGLFYYEQLHTLISRASAGQRRKIQLARLIAQRPNVLILDEPTNYLSLDVLESFETAINDFTGTVIAISHDRRFLENYNGVSLTLENGQLVR
jgi:macrolide transport system ATP-binding/permease protein